MPIIEVKNLRKTYRVKELGSGFIGNLKSLVSPKSREIEAVKNISFSITRGERIAFIGPNGAGKSTTIKMLTGILYPTAGSAEVAGHTPWESREALCYKIGSIVGQRSQLWYDLPARDTFNLLARIYEIDATEYKKRSTILIELFSLAPLLSKPVRQLSLGERMRCEIVGSLLHNPQILFLDEPTIGLDVTSKAVIRDLIRDSSQRDSLTVFLTSHDTGDIEGVCDRVMVINDGRLLVDQSLYELRRTYIKRKIVKVQTSQESIELSLAGVRKIASQPHQATFDLDTSKNSIEQVVQSILRNAELKDMTVEDPPLEDIIKQIYADTASTEQSKEQPR